MAFMDFDELLEANVRALIDDIFASGRRHKHIVASHLGLTIGVEKFCFLMAKRAAAAWTQLRFSKIFDGMAIEAPYNELKSSSPSFSAISFLLIVRYFSGAVHDRASAPEGLTLCHHFCTAG